MNYGQMKSNAKSLTTSAAKAAKSYSETAGMLNSIKGLQNGKTGFERIKSAIELFGKFGE